MLSLTNLLTLSAILAPAAANFHFVGESAGLFTVDYVLPSNKYNCDSIGSYGYISTGSVGDSYFQATGNICGVSTLDFYKRSDGHYDFYKHNGNGDLQGTCYSNSGSLNCPGQTEAVVELLVCYSYICES